MGKRITVRRHPDSGYWLVEYGCCDTPACSSTGSTHERQDGCDC